MTKSDTDAASSKEDDSENDEVEICESASEKENGEKVPPADEKSESEKGDESGKDEDVDKAVEVIAVTEKDGQAATVPSAVGPPVTQTVDAALSVGGRSRSASASSSRSARSDSSAPSVASKSHSRSKRRKVYIDSDASRSGSDEGYDDGRSDADSANKPCSGWPHDISFVDMLPQQFDVCGMRDRTGVLTLFQLPKVKDASYIRVGIHGTSHAVRQCRRALVTMGALDVGRDPFSPGPGQLPMPTFRDMHGLWLNFCLPLPLMDRVIKHANEVENAFCIKMRTRLHVPEEQLGTVFMQGCLDDVMAAKKRLVVLCHIPVLEVNPMVAESWQHHPGTTVSDPGPPSPVRGGHFLSAPTAPSPDVVSNASSYEAPCHRKPLVLRPRKKSPSISRKKSAPQEDAGAKNEDVPAEPKTTKRRRVSRDEREPSRNCGDSVAPQKHPTQRKATLTRRLSSESHTRRRGKTADGDGAKRARDKQRAGDERVPSRQPRSRSADAPRRRRRIAVHLSPARNSTHHTRDATFPSPVRMTRRRSDRSEARVVSPKKRTTHRHHRDDSEDFVEMNEVPRRSATRAALRTSSRQQQDKRGRSRSPKGKHSSKKRPMPSNSPSRVDEVIPRPRARKAATVALKQQQQKEEQTAKKHKKKKREFSDSDLRSPAPDDRRKKKKVKPKKQSQIEIDDDDSDSPVEIPVKKRLPQRREVVSDVEHIEIPKKKSTKKKAKAVAVSEEEPEVVHVTPTRSKKDRMNAVAYTEIQRAKELERDDERSARDRGKTEIETKKRRMREKLSARKESSGKEPRKRNTRRGGS